MSFEADITADENRAQYKQLKQQSGTLVSQLTAWQGTYTQVRASVDAAKQAELDAKRTQFISLLQTALGI